MEQAIIDAIASVESNGSGFTASNLTVLYEPHVAWKQANKQERELLASKGLAAKRWGDIPYPRSNAARWKQIEAAAEVMGEEKAYRCASFGAFQIMGFNYKLAGFSTASKMVASFKEGYHKHLEGFLSFIKSHPSMVSALNKKDWATFARLYNGPGYKKNNYDTKLRDAYAKFSGSTKVLKRGDKGPVVKDIQGRLRSLGYLLDVDGVFGPQTKRVLKTFQRRYGLGQSGRADEETIKTLLKLT